MLQKFQLYLELAFITIALFFCMKKLLAGDFETGTTWMLILFTYLKVDTLHRSKYRMTK
jgi:hypothetical protein